MKLKGIIFYFQMCLMIALISLIVPPQFIQAQHASVRIQVIDRGQADGILVRTPNEKWVVIDGGADALQAQAMQGTWDVDTVELAIITHRHYDHLGGMDEILREIPVKQILFDMRDRPNMISDDTIRAIINRKNISVLVWSEDTLSIDNISFVIFGQPPESLSSHNENNNCIVVKLEFGEFSMLFPGDAEIQQLNWLINTYSNGLDADVLKASHHGSNNGTNDNWLQTVTPQYVIISAGVNATHKHPHSDAVNDYLSTTNNRVYCTNRHGTVRFYGFDDGRIWVRKQRDINKSCEYDGTHY